METVVKEDPHMIIDYPDIIPDAVKIDEMVKQQSRHACGVVISSKPLIDYTPLYTSSRHEGTTTQWDHEDLEGIGFTKFDFLRIDNLTIIDKTLQLLAKENITIDIDSIPLDDEETFNLIRSSLLDGIFQMESEGMRNTILEIQPKTLEEISDVIALYRPGPIEAGFLKGYILNKKNGGANLDTDHKLYKILGKTYGVPVYQEQIMAMAKLLAGYNDIEADSLRKAIGKKKEDEMAKHYEQFTQGLIKFSDFSEEEAVKLWDSLKEWANYGFCAAHSIAYAFLAYQTAWLKAHHPLEFTCALLATRCNSQADRVQKYIQSARSAGIKFLGADINKSDEIFILSPEENTIVFGLSALKGLGAKASEAIVKARKGKPYKDLYDFLHRVNTTVVNGAVFKVLVSVGAFDSLGYNRKDIYSKADDIYDYIKAFKDYGIRMVAYEERVQEVSDYISLYGDIPGSRKEDRARPRGKVLPVKPEPVEVEMGTSSNTFTSLNREYKIMGMYLSGHPGDLLDIADGDPSMIADLKDLPNNSERDMILIVPSPEPVWKNNRSVVVNVQDREGAAATATIMDYLYDKFKDNDGMTIAVAKVVSGDPEREGAMRFKIKTFDIVYPANRS